MQQARMQEGADSKGMDSLSARDVGPCCNCLKHQGSLLAKKLCAALFSLKSKHTADVYMQNYYLIIYCVRSCHKH